MSAHRHVCPSCGGRKFYAPAHVMEEWVVDECGNFIECSGFLEVYSEPDDDSVWVCFSCGEEAVLDEGVRSGHE